MPRKKKSRALVEGSKAFANGLELKDNPYDPSDQANLLWEQGWKLASEKRKDYFHRQAEQEALDQIENFGWVTKRLTPKELQRYSSSILSWPVISGIIVLIGLTLGFNVIVALVTFFIFVYSCAAVFVLVRHFAGQYGNQLWQKALSYTTGVIIGLIIILFLWELMTFVLDRLGIVLW